MRRVSHLLDAKQSIFLSLLFLIQSDVGGDLRAVLSHLRSSLVSTLVRSPNRMPSKALPARHEHCGRITLVDQGVCPEEVCSPNRSACQSRARSNTRALVHRNVRRHASESCDQDVVPDPTDRRAGQGPQRTHARANPTFVVQPSVRATSTMPDDDALVSRVDAFSRGALCGIGAWERGGTPGPVCRSWRIDRRGPDGCPSGVGSARRTSR